MGRFCALYGVGITVAALAMGCQNKLADENRELHAQNRELQAQLDEAHRQRDTQPPAPQIVQPTPRPASATLPPPAAQPKPDLGNLETTEDVAAGTTTVTLPGDVFFDPGRAKIKDSAMSSLDKVVAALKTSYAGKTVRVNGFTDTDPIRQSHWKSNQELSQARANAVRNYLVKKGIESSRITTQGLGEARPKGTKAQSRRVEVVVITR